MPLANSYVLKGNLERRERTYPLHVRVCENCLLVQHDADVSPEEMFREYAYFSSVSKAWVEHARTFVHMAHERFGLGPDSKVVEIASNDGYLLTHFVDLGVPVLGVDPARNIAAIARRSGVPTEAIFFSLDNAKTLADRGDSADLIVANNVLAHVPDINDVMSGIKRLLKPHGVLTAEFPHLLPLLEGIKFDTIYHEHFFYYSLLSFEAILNHHGLKVFDVQRLPTHGGSLRVFACHAENATLGEMPGLLAVRRLERRAKLDRLDAYRGFGERVRSVKRALLAFLDRADDETKSVAGFGAAAKGSTLLNYCGVSNGQIEYVVDETPAKVGKYLPGSHLPIVPLETIGQTRPDFILILPWNHKTEIMGKLAFVRAWDAHFVVPLPWPTICG